MRETFTKQKECGQLVMWDDIDDTVSKNEKESEEKREENEWVSRETPCTRCEHELRVIMRKQEFNYFATLTPRMNELD